MNEMRRPTEQNRSAARRARASFVGLALLSGFGCAFELADVLTAGGGGGSGAEGGVSDGGPSVGDDAGAAADTGADTEAGNVETPRGQPLGAACPSELDTNAKRVVRLAVTASEIYAVCGASFDVTRPISNNAVVRGPLSVGKFLALSTVTARVVVRVGSGVVIAGHDSGGTFGFFRPDGSLINPGSTGWVQMASAGNIVIAGGYANADGLWCFDATSCVPPDGGQNGCATQFGAGGAVVGLAVSGTTILHYGWDQQAKFWVRPLDGSAKYNPPLFAQSTRTRPLIPLGVAAVAGQAYFALDADVLTCPLSVTSCAQQPYVAGEASDVVLVTADGKRPIWVTGSTVRYADAPNAAKTLAESPGELITALVVEDGVAYWGTDQGNIYRRALPP